MREGDLGWGASQRGSEPTHLSWILVVGAGCMDEVLFDEGPPDGRTPNVATKMKNIPSYTKHPTQNHQPKDRQKEEDQSDQNNSQPKESSEGSSRQRESRKHALASKPTPNLHIGACGTPLAWGSHDYRCTRRHNSQGPTTCNKCNQALTNIRLLGECK